MQWQEPVAAPSLPSLVDFRGYLVELARLATERSMKNPIHAEIVPGVEPAWYALVVQPGSERAAASHLSKRGFGVYLPEFEKTTIARGVKKSRMLPMFPTYLFAFVWGLGRHWRRIATCPGVMRALTPPGDDQALVIPDRIIDKIQAVEAELMFHGGIVQRGHVIERKKKRSRRKKPGHQRKDPDLPAHVQLGPSQELVTITTKSYFESVGTLDGMGRNSLLHKALGLAL